MNSDIWTPYCGAAPVPSELMSRWNGDPLLLLAIAAIAAAGLARGPSGRRLRLAATATMLAFLFVTPFCALTSALFSARVVHHLLLTVVVAPLLAGLAPPIRNRAWLVVATAAQAVIFWLWHAPPTYAAALSSDAAYWLMQTTMLAGGVAFWIALRTASAPAAVAALLATMVQMGLLGALITFAPAPLYAPHFGTTAPWGLSALEDQQLAGLIMWVPAAGLYLGAALVLAARALASPIGRTSTE